MKRIVLTSVFTVVWGFCCLGQENVASPAATEFVRYERIPVSYFNGLPSIEIPLYTVEYKDLVLPISLSYHASGIKVNQYPAIVGLGWTLNAGGGITRVVNGKPDETCGKDETDQSGTGLTIHENTGYFYSSQYLDRDNWASEENIKTYMGISSLLDYDTEPDEFVINACGLSGSIYFYRDRNGAVRSVIKSNNGESFSVEPPVIKDNPEEIIFTSRSQDNNPKSFRLYKLIYEFTVIKNDGTRLVFGGDNDCIEFYTQRYTKTMDDDGSQSMFMKTWPSSWMLRKIISPAGNEIGFTYRRDGSPIIISDVRTNLWTYDSNGNVYNYPAYNTDEGKSFIIQHPVYLEKITADGELTVSFSMSKAGDLNTVGKSDENYLRYDGFSDAIVDKVSYDEGADLGRICYSPHNYKLKLNEISVQFPDFYQSFKFRYIENESERLKLKSIEIDGRVGALEKRYGFTYDSRKLPAYNSTVTDNWGYWNGKNYRSIGIEDDFFGFRQPSESLAKAETLTGITWPTGGRTEFDYELNDYSKVATQVPDFDILEQSGTAGGLRIRTIRYITDTTSYIHSFEYKNEDGSSSGILSGIPVYVAEGHLHREYFSSGRESLVWYKIHGTIDQSYKMLSEAYINMLGLTSGNHVTYSRVTESVGASEPLVKEYLYTNHDSCPDTEDYDMYTNMDDMSLYNAFTSRALERGLLVSERWYSSGHVVKETEYSYNSSPAREEEYVKAIEKFSIDGIPWHPVTIPFMRYAPYKILTFYPYLESRKETLYDPSGETVISLSEEHYTYNGNLRVKTRTRKDSEEMVETTLFTYPDEYEGGVFPEMNSRGIISLPVETVVFRDGKVIGGTLNEFAERHSVIIPEKVWNLDLAEAADSAGFERYSGAGRDDRYVLESEVLDSDRYGNPLLIRRADGTVTACQWGYSGAWPTAVVHNAAVSSGDTLRTVYVNQNFESGTGVTIFPFGYCSEKCQVGPYAVTVGDTGGRRWILDYRVYRNGRWQYVRKTMDADDAEYTIDEGIRPIDDVRAFPEDASVETYTWYPFVGLRSRTDGGGVTESYRYDSFQNLMTVHDNSGNLIAHYGYNYGGTTESVLPTLYGNEDMSMAFFSHPSDGSIPDMALYTVPEYTYSSYESQADANRLAYEDIMRNGQKYADEHGEESSVIVIYVYNPKEVRYIMQYSWGSQGNIRYADYTVASGVRVAWTGDVRKDYTPTVFYLPRQNYRGIMLLNDDGEAAYIEADSGFTETGLFYLKEYYPEYMDTYIIHTLD